MTAIVLNAATKNSKIAIKKGLKRGGYKTKVRISAKGNASYKAKTKTVTAKVVVR